MLPWVSCFIDLVLFAVGKLLCEILIKLEVQYVIIKPSLFGSGSEGRISWDRNSIFSWDQIFDQGDRIFDHEIKFQFVHEVEFV